MAQPPRILQLVTQEETGGVQVLTEIVAEGLRRRGFEVETRALRAGGARSTVANMAALARDITTRPPDAVFSYQAGASVFGNLLGWMARVPVRAVHATALPDAVRPHWRWLDRVWATLGIATDVVSNSVATRAAFTSYPERYRRRIVDIAHGVSTIPLGAGRIDWRARLGIPPAAPALVSMGRLAEQKNHTVLVEALAQLWGVHAIVAGEGPERPALEALAQRLGVADRLHLIGDVARADLGDLLAAGSVFVFPSRWESFGLAAVEAGMYGLPIVAADLPVLREVLADGLPAAAPMVRYHPVEDGKALARAAYDLLVHYPTQPERRTFAAALKARHGVAGMITRYVEFLEARGLSAGAFRATERPAARAPAARSF